jgi:copper transport protein
MRRRLTCALVGIALAGVLAGAAAAHPRLAGTAPAAGARLDQAPRAVVIRLSEHSEPVGDGISVTGPDGREVAHGPVVVGPSSLTRTIDARQHGSYVVEWLAVGSDSHPARGAFFFSVGEPTRAVLPGPARAGRTLEALGRWLSLLGFALGFGVPFAALLSGGMTARLWRLVSAGVVLLIVAEPVALLGQTALLAPSRMFEPQLIEDVLLTSYGHLAGLRLGAAVGLWALAGAIRGSTPGAQWSIPAAGAVVAIIEAGNAHRFDGLPSTIAVLLVAVHVAAFAAWVGCIAVAVAESRARAVAHPASLAAFALVVTGAGLALGHLESVSDLVETGYGATLSVKIALVAIAFALGAAARHRAELAAALAVLAAASLLVSLAPPV